MTRVEGRGSNSLTVSNYTLEILFWSGNTSELFGHRLNWVDEPVSILVVHVQTSLQLVHDTTRAPPPEEMIVGHM
jgi:hypothetical protein